ncbi:MAG: helix-turn-helix domain-containing protein [Cyclobacteriaceae bacterium]
MSRYPQNKQIDTYRRLVRARQFMDRHYHSPIDLKIISDKACLSQYHFLREFRKTFGKTPHQYLTYIRIGWAKHWLKISDFTVTEICFKVGFESLGSFSSLFRKSTNCCPTQFRIKCRQAQVASECHPSMAIPGCFMSGQN